MAKNTQAAEAEQDTAVKVKKAKKDKGEKSSPSTSPSDGADYGLSAPGSGGNFTPRDHANELLLISPLSLEEGVVTSNGTKDAIKADVVVLNKSNPAKSEEISGALIFPKVLQGQLQTALSHRTRVVGTLIEDVASKKAGQNAPWRLTAPSDADIQVARSYLDSLNPLR